MKPFKPGTVVIAMPSTPEEKPVLVTVTKSPGDHNYGWYLTRDCKGKVLWVKGNLLVKPVLKHD